uniref:Secreted protein n=1 Tax=Ixodes ricinus TaxID=34613 RepID=A0A6B0UFA7_IXORI
MCVLDCWVILVELDAVLTVAVNPVLCGLIRTCPKRVETTKTTMSDGWSRGILFWMLRNCSDKTCKLYLGRRFFGVYSEVIGCCFSVIINFYIYWRISPVRI